MTQPTPVTVPASTFAAAALEVVAEAMRLGTIPVMESAMLYRHQAGARDLLVLADRFDRPIEWQGDPETDSYIPKVRIPIGTALTDEIKIEYVVFGRHAEVDYPGFTVHNESCVPSEEEIGRRIDAAAAEGHAAKGQHGSSDPDYPSDPKPQPYPVPRAVDPWDNPCAGDRCPDPAAHAEGAHDL